MTIVKLCSIHESERRSCSECKVLTCERADAIPAPDTVKLAEALATIRGWMDRGCPPETKGHIRAALDRIEAG